LYGKVTKIISSVSNSVAVHWTYDSYKTTRSRRYKATAQWYV